MKTEIINLVRVNNETGITLKEIAQKLDVSVQKIVGLLPQLKEELTFSEDKKLFIKEQKEEETVDKKRGRVIDPNSKQQRAIVLFDETKPRKEMIEILQKELSLTKNGASTYYQNIKKMKGLVKSK